MSDCQAGYAMMYIHVTAISANCQDDYPEISLKCPFKHKSEKKAGKNRAHKKKETNKSSTQQEIEN